MFSIFKKKQSFIDIFQTYVDKSFPLLTAARFGDEEIALTYLPALMFVLADLIAFEKGKNRRDIYDSITRTIFKAVSSPTEFDGACAFFDKCVEYYVPFIKGKKSWSLWSLGGWKLPNYPWVACISAFLDIFYNPSIAERGYDNAEIPIHNAFEVMDFAVETAKPFIMRMVEYYDEVERFFS